MPNPKRHGGIDEDDLFDDLYEQRIKEVKYLSTIKLMENYKEKYSNIIEIVIFFKPNETKLIDTKYNKKQLNIQVYKLYLILTNKKVIPCSLLNLYNEFKAKRIYLTTTNQNIIKNLNNNNEFSRIDINGKITKHNDILYYPININNKPIKEYLIDEINEDIQEYEEFINDNQFEDDDI